MTKIGHQNCMFSVKFIIFIFINVVPNAAKTAGASSQYPVWVVCRNYDLRDI